MLFSFNKYLWVVYRLVIVCCKFIYKQKFTHTQI